MIGDESMMIESFQCSLVNIQSWVSEMLHQEIDDYEQQSQKLTMNMFSSGQLNSPMQYPTYLYS
jgi:hypothetical protein